MKTHKALQLLTPLLILAAPPAFAQPHPPVHPTPGPLSATAPPAHPAAPDLKCQVRGHPWDPVFQDMKGVALYVEVVPVKYSQAVECHGREESCAEKYAGKGPSHHRDELIRQLKADYSAFPAPLHYDNLVKEFTDGITSKILPYVTPQNCTRPPVAVYSISDLQPSADEKHRDILTVAVKLHIIDSMAVMNVNLYRPDQAHSDFASQVQMEQVGAIPSGLPEEQLAAWVKGFANSFRVDTRETVKP
jgi:hypothetical protein